MIDLSQFRNVEVNYISTDGDFSFPTSTFYIELMKHEPSGDEFPFRASCPNGGNEGDIVAHDLNYYDGFATTSLILYEPKLNSLCTIYSDNINSVIWQAKYYTGEYVGGDSLTPNEYLATQMTFVASFVIIGFIAWLSYKFFTK